MSLEKIINCIKNNKSFLITSHKNLEGDALGTELAFFRLLKAMGKKAIIVNEDRLPPRFDFLPGINNIKKFNKKNLKYIKFDCFVALDCSDLRRCGEVSRINIDNKIVLNIDHHRSNEKFGDIDWIEPGASSCSEMIYKLYKKLNVTIDKDTALLLYVGILTDTGSFRYANTTSLAHKIVAELLKYKLDIRGIYKYVYENITFYELRLLNKILPTIKFCHHGKVAWFQIDRNILKNKKISFDLTEYVLSFARAIKDVEVAVSFKENLGKKYQTRVNLRSEGKVDVNKIACFFGGGGHRTASGCTIKGKIEKVKRKVLNKIKKSLK